MITKEDYLKALDVVTEYHSQLKVEVEEHTKTLTENWVNAHQDKMSARLLNAVKYRNDDWSTKPKFIEDWTKSEFLKMRNAGLKTWHEFEKLRSGASDVDVLHEC